MGANAVSVLAQARWRFWGRVCGDQALACHAAAIAPAWIWFLVEEQLMERGDQNRPRGLLTLLGVTLSIVGTWLVAAGFRKVGPGALVNADVFSDSPRQWQTDGVYGYIADPIYLGYGLNLAGRALRRRSPQILVVAAWLSALLLAVEAPIERWAHRKP